MVGAWIAASSLSSSLGWSQAFLLFALDLAAEAFADFRDLGGMLILQACQQAAGPCQSRPAGSAWEPPAYLVIECCWMIEC